MVVVVEEAAVVAAVLVEAVGVHPVVVEYLLVGLVAHIRRPFSFLDFASSLERDASESTETHISRDMRVTYSNEVKQ